MSIAAAEDLIPQSTGAMVLTLVDPLELRIIENIRLLAAADVDLLNVVVGQDLGGWCFSPRGGPPDVVINSGKLLWFKSLCSWGLVDDAGSGTQAGGSVAHHSRLLR